MQFYLTMYLILLIFMRASPYLSDEVTLCIFVLSRHSLCYLNCSDEVLAIMPRWQNLSLDCWYMLQFCGHIIIIIMNEYD